ncbi:helix-turn-helix domain-containing protein [Paenibacillus eucommiae]|uniref:AraC-like DNA-binding protein n=1 Tax=Paenibacillus eucommiae TaxID=1355755 RepID=A0ABS4J345_9BACL|nr:helix-turn-helix domain-containing protein [Paenibacillus eucommiae]MBP1994250.1 AraC-like DNA-binding protein [Paenibacillus eucommiae]
MARSRRFYGYLLSYMVIVTLSLLVFGSLAYRIFMSSLGQEIEKSGVSQLLQVRDIIETRMLEMKRIAVRISLNPALTSYTIDGGGYQLMETKRILNDYMSSNGFISDIGIYYMSREDDMIFGARGNYAVDTYFDAVYRYATWKAADFQKESYALNSPVMRPLQSVVVNRSDQRSLATYLYPIPANASKPYGVVLFQIEERTFGNLLGNALRGNKGYVYVLDGGGQMVAAAGAIPGFANGEEFLGEISADRIPQGMSSYGIDGLDYRLVKLTSEFNNWTYIIALPANQLLTGVYKAKALFFGLLTGILLAGMLMSVFFAIRNYRPLQALAGHVRQHRGYDATPPGRKDEFQLISNIMDEVTEENRELQTRIKTQAALVKERMLGRLLEDAFANHEERNEALRVCGLTVSSEHFRVIVFDIDDHEGFMRNTPRPSVDVMLFSLRHMVEDLACEVTEAQCCAALERGGQRGVSLVFQGGSGTTELTIREMTQRASLFFQQAAGYTLTAGIGCEYSAASRIKDSFAEAQHAARYRFMRGGNRPFFYSEMMDLEMRNLRLPLDRVDANVEMALKQGSEEKMKSYIVQIVERLSAPGVSIETAENLTTDFAMTLWKAASDIGILTDSSAHLKMEESLNEKFETISLWGQRMEDICSELCQMILDNRKSKNDQLYPKLIAYIQQNFADNMLSLDKIADSFGISSSYATRYFKEQTGYSLMQYLDLVRMNEARELLRQSDVILKGIIPQVGYVDESHFIRKFKKHEGVTPNEYRNTHRGGSRVI